MLPLPLQDLVAAVAVVEVVEGEVVEDRKIRIVRLLGITAAAGVGAGIAGTGVGLEVRPEVHHRGGEKAPEVVVVVEEEVRVIVAMIRGAGAEVGDAELGEECQKRRR